MKPLFSAHPLSRLAIATGTTVIVSLLVIARLFGAEPNAQHQSTPSSAQPIALTEDHAALLARLTKILNYGGEYGGLGKPGKTDAVIALGLVGDERAVPALIEHLLNEENKNLRLQIVRALGWIGSQQAVPVLEQTLQDKYPLLRKQAADALKTITGREYEYDKSGLPDINKMRELIRASAKESS